MISGLRLLEQFENKYSQKKEISYTLNSQILTRGPLRSIQKFVVILLTDIGSDPIRPWFGTKINALTLSNVTNKAELELFVRTECNSAIAQFFELQAKESTQNNQTGYDVIQGLELTNVQITSDNQIALTFKFTPLKTESITFIINL